jgi:C-terminal processing protease CtpA/Prc
MILPGETATVAYTVPGMTSEAIWKVASSIDYSPFTYATLPGEKIGVMTINTFQGAPGQFLAPAFTQIQDDNIDNLIIDIRSNPGGNYDQVDTLMKYLTNQPYRHCSVRFARYVVDISSPPREIECDLIEPLDLPLRYKGKLYLLIGPDTFSAAITFATILQDYDLALLIGEETGDKASYCAYTSDPLSLTRTHLRYQCPADCFVRPGGISDNHGVIPDVVVKTRIQDRFAGVDPVLAKALELIRSNTPPP